MSESHDYDVAPAGCCHQPCFGKKERRVCPVLGVVAGVMSGSVEGKIGVFGGTQQVFCKERAINQGCSLELSVSNLHWQTCEPGCGLGGCLCRPLQGRARC